MPELPEVQAHAERLSTQFEGAVLQKFVPFNFTALKTAVPPAISAIAEAESRSVRLMLMSCSSLGFPLASCADISVATATPFAAQGFLRASRAGFLSQPPAS